MNDLADELLSQLQQLEVPAEIILLDDGSQEFYRKSNRELSARLKYIELPANIGRAAIRNHFLQHARYNYLLFLDGDSRVIDPDFLNKYLQAIQANPDTVIYGGRRYPDQVPDNNHRLNWLYGVKKEMHQGETTFMSHNFAIPKTTFEQVRFEEQLTTYGHEDTLFGFQLRSKGVRFIRIDIPVLNGHLETNALFLHKTEEGIKNLRKLLEITNYNPQLIREITLLRTYFKLKPLSLVLRPAFRLIRPWCKNLLINGHAGISCFDLYKLGMLFATMQQER